VVETLSALGISHAICGGTAVQHYGYHRGTSDVDVIVMDTEYAKEELIGSNSGFKAGKYANQVVHIQTQVDIDLLRGGDTVRDDQVVKLPLPKKSNYVPNYITLAQLISIKIDVARDNIHRLQDRVDANKLIVNNDLPRNFSVDPNILEEYQEIWDELH
jgi:hypothetical protein